MKWSTLLGRRLLKTGILVVVLLAIRAGVPYLIDWSADYDATSNGSLSDDDLRTQFTELADANNFVLRLHQEGLTCITDKDMRDKNAAALTGLIMPYVDYKPWLQKNYTREDLQKSVAFLSTPDGKAFMGVTTGWFGWVIAQTKTAPDGHPEVPGHEIIMHQFALTMRDYAKGMNFVQKERFVHFMRQGLGGKLIGFYVEVMKQVGEITNTAAIAHPDLDKKISPLLAPYYNDFRNDRDISCRKP